MSRTYEIEVHDVERDGYPDLDNDDTVGRVAFIWDGELMSGWPLNEVPGDYTTPHTGVWEASDDCMGSGYSGVRQWVLFPVPFWSLSGVSDD